MVGRLRSQIAFTTATWAERGRRRLPRGLPDKKFGVYHDDLP